MLNNRAMAHETASAGRAYVQAHFSEPSVVAAWRDFSAHVAKS
ncbi:MAG: hypothetical protein WDN04_28105 [Rhodospirillales bacterium]